MTRCWSPLCPSLSRASLDSMTRDFESSLRRRRNAVRHCHPGLGLYVQPSFYRAQKLYDTVSRKDKTRPVLPFQGSQHKRPADARQPSSTLGRQWDNLAVGISSLSSLDASVDITDLPCVVTQEPSPLIKHSVPSLYKWLPFS